MTITLAFALLSLASAGNVPDESVPPGIIIVESNDTLLHEKLSPAEPLAYQEPEPYSLLSCGSHALSVGTYTIKSPRYPSVYTHNYDCTYDLKPASGASSLSIRCNSFEVERHSKCSYDYLKFNRRIYCGTATTSGVPKMLGLWFLKVVFHTDGSVAKKGFDCTITVAPSATGGGINNNCNCGVPGPRNKIHGGHSVVKGEYPWYATLVHHPSGRFFCGGSLINDRYVLTAAHCIDSKSTSSMRVKLGRYSHRSTSGESTHTVSRIIIHPNLSKQLQLGHDTALLKLSYPVSFTSLRAPVCLPTGHRTYAYTQARIIGFGYTKNSLPSTLQEATIQVISNSQCVNTWNLLSGNQICVDGYPSTTTCSGDSGGGMLAWENSRYSVIGVVSFGPTGGCGEKNLPSVMSRVTFEREWIKAQTGDAFYCT